MNNLAASPLGHASVYRETYDPTLLFAVERAPMREKLGLPMSATVFGEDVWTMYEVSWLDAVGKPAVAIATLRVPASSACIVESKSVKLYLVSLNQTRFGDATEVVA